MKKGLLSILASALLVVGCQNYDDQFSALETQINALASTVAGLSQVQSDLSSLSAQVNAISGAIDASVDAALAGGLADIDAAIETLSAAAEAAANNSDITAIAEDVVEVQGSLAELLAQSSVFSSNITVNSPATLDAFHKMGSSINIVNGFVDIDVSTEMDIVQVQEFVDFIKVTTGDFAYTAGTNVDTEITFNNLAGTASLTVDQEGGYAFQALESATVVTLDDDSSVKIVDLRKLASVTSLSDGSGAGTFTFNKATELHLTVLPRSPHAALSLGVDEGGVIDISALTDSDALGKAVKLDLTIAGPDSITISSLTGDKAGSDIFVSETINLTVNGYDGKINIGQDVQNFTSDNIVDIAITGDDLVSFNGTGALDPNATTADTAGPALDLSSQGDLETVTTAGTFTTVKLDGNGNMTTATIGGTITGAGGLTVSNNSDLTTLNVSGLTTDKVVVDTNSDLETVTIDHTTAAGEATTQEGTITINKNESMTSLTVAVTAVDNLSIQNNADLETIDLSGMTTIGATGTASVSINGNKLEASLADDENDAFTTASGMDTAQVYLDAVAADADSEANVTFDTVESVENASGVETASDALDYAVLVLTPKIVTTPPADATASKRAVGITSAQLNAATIFDIRVGARGAANGQARLLVSGAESPTFLNLDANETLAIAEIKRAAALTRATAYDLVLDAHKGFAPSGKITFANAANDSEQKTTATGTIADIRANDFFNLTIDGITVSGTAGVLMNTASSVAQRVAAIWNADAKYGSIYKQNGSASDMLGGQASAVYTIWGVSHDAGDAFITITTTTQAGRRGYDKAYTFALVTATTTTTPVLAWQNGDSAGGGDDKTISGGIIVTVESAGAGKIGDTATNVAFYFGAEAANTTSATELTSSLYTNAKLRLATATNVYPNEARGDAVNAEGGITEVATAATSTDRTAWLN